MAWSAVTRRRRIVYPMPDSAVVVKDFAIPDHWARAYGLDVRWLATAVIWGARDPESDVLYLYCEYFREAEPAAHVAAIRARGVWIPGLIDAQANGRTQVDGARLIRMYRELGLALQPIDNPLESGVTDLWQRMQSGRLKVFTSVSAYLDERRLYRRDEKDQIVKEHDNLQDATRCLVNGIARLCTKPVPHVYLSSTPIHPSYRLSIRPNRFKHASADQCKRLTQNGQPKAGVPQQFKLPVCPASAPG
jgi:hypothetical protein